MARNLTVAIAATLVAVLCPAGAAADPVPLTPSYGTGTTGGGAGQISYAGDVSLGPDGNVYVADSLNNRIDVFSAQGAFLRAFGFDVIPGGSTGFETCTTATTCKAAAAAGGVGGLNDPVGVAVDANGTVYVADDENHRIDEFQSNGDFIRAFGKDVNPSGGTGFEVCTTNCKPGVPGATAGELAFPMSIDLDASGNAFVTDVSPRVSVYTATGTFLRAFGWDVIPGGSTGLETCTTATTCQQGASGGGAGQLAQGSRGVLLDASGNLYIADTSNARVDVFTAAGTFQRAFGWDVIPGGSTGLETCTTTCKPGLAGGGPGELSNPSGVSLDPIGNVDVADFLNHRVSVFTPQGAFVRGFGWDVVPGGATGYEVCTSSCKAGVSGSGVGQFQGPFGITTDCAGNIFVADSGNLRIQRLGEPGTALTPPCPSNPPPPAPPSNDFSFGKLKLDKRKGTATLAVDLPGPGEVTLAGKDVKSVDEQAQAGTTLLPIKVTGKSKKKLRKRGKFNAKVSVSFTPTGGTANELTRIYKLKRKKRKR